MRDALLDVHGCCCLRINRREQKKIAASCSCERNGLLYYYFLCQNGRETGQGNWKGHRLFGKETEAQQRAVFWVYCVSTSKLPLTSAHPREVGVSADVAQRRYRFRGDQVI